MRTTVRGMRYGGGLVVAAALAAGASVGTPVGRDVQAVTGTVRVPAGVDARGVMVTARHADGRTVTVYTDRAGGYALPGLSPGSYRVEAWLAGAGRAAVDRVEIGDGPPPAVGLDLSADAASPAPAPGSAYLGMLPGGDAKRRFVLDCTGCHVWDGGRMESGGVPRSREGWRDAAARMVAQFGPGSGFPIVSSWADPDALADLLHATFSDAAPPTPGRLPVALTEGAEGAVLTEYPVPEPADLPHDLMVAPDGRVVVTGMFTHRMYVFDPGNGAVETVPIPVQNANPRALDIDGEGRWWVLLGAPQRVASYDPRLEAWESWDIGAYPHSIDLDTEGRVWFNGHFTVDPELVGVLDPGTGGVRRFEVPAGRDADSEPGESTVPYGLRVGPDGAVWGTQLRGGHLLRLDPSSGEVDQWKLPVDHAGPRRPDVAPDGTVWIPGYASGELYRFDPEEESFTRYPLPLPDVLPYVVRVDPARGTVWIGTGHGDVVFAFDPATERFTAYPLPTRGALVRHLDVAPRTGEVWAAYGASPGIPGRILRIQP